MNSVFVRPQALFGFSCAVLQDLFLGALGLQKLSLSLQPMLVTYVLLAFAFSSSFRELGAYAWTVF